MKMLITAALVAATASPLAAQTIAITGARVLTGAGQTIENATLVMRDGKIIALSRGGAVPSGAVVVDGQGKTVTPGLINSATTIGIVEIDAVDETNDAASRNPGITAAFDVQYGLNPYSTLIPIERDGGVTHAVVVPGARSSIIAGQGAVIQLAGGTAAAMLVRPRVAMFGLLDEGAAERTGGARGTAVLRFRELLEDVRAYAADRAAYERRARRDLSLSRLDLDAMVPVVKGEMPLVLTVNRAPDILNALALAREFRLKLVLSGVAEGWMVASQIAAAGVPVVVNPLTDIPGYDALGATLENAARLARAGVTITFATFDAHNARNLRFFAGNAVASGLPYDAALAAITSTPARVWGIADRVGTLTVGRDADLVVWSGDPFELLTRAERVYIGGVEQPGDNRQQALLERYRHLNDSLPPQYRH